MAPLRFYDGTQWTPHLGPVVGSTQPSGLDPTNATHRMLVPIGRTPLSIVAGYVALFSVLLIPAPLALVLGICAFVQIRHRPNAYGRGRAIFAIGMGSMFTAVLILVLLAANHII